MAGPWLHNEIPPPYPSWNDQKVGTSAYMSFHRASDAPLTIIAGRRYRQGASVSSWALAASMPRRHQGSEQLSVFQRSEAHAYFEIAQANTLVNERGNAMLCDFGLARVLEEIPSGLTTRSTRIGTLRYVSPELMMDARHTRESDVWAWACLLLEVCFVTLIKLFHSNAPLC